VSGRSGRSEFADGGQGAGASASAWCWYLIGRIVRCLIGAELVHISSMDLWG
jgi:hypothetical protein